MPELAIPKLKRWEIGYTVTSPDERGKIVQHEIRCIRSILQEKLNRPLIFVKLGGVLSYSCKEPFCDNAEISWTNVDQMYPYKRYCLDHASQIPMRLPNGNQFEIPELPIKLEGEHTGLARVFYPEIDDYILMLTSHVLLDEGIRDPLKLNHIHFLDPSKGFCVDNILDIVKKESPQAEPFVRLARPFIASLHDIPTNLVLNIPTIPEDIYMFDPSDFIGLPLGGQPSDFDFPEILGYRVQGKNS